MYLGTFDDMRAALNVLTRQRGLPEKDSDGVPTLYTDDNAIVQNVSWEEQPTIGYITSTSEGKWHITWADGTRQDVNVPSAR